MNPKFPEIRKFLFSRAIPVTSEPGTAVTLTYTEQAASELEKNNFPKHRTRNINFACEPQHTHQQGEQGCSESCCPPAGTTGTHQGQGPSWGEGTPRGAGHHEGAVTPLELAPQHPRCCMAELLFLHEAPQVALGDAKPRSSSPSR